MNASLGSRSRMDDPVAAGDVIRPGRSELGCMLLVSAFMALFFHQGADWPVTNYFPLLELLRDPGFLPNDFTTRTFREFSARHYIAHLWHGIATTLDVHYRYVVAWGNLARLFLTGIFFWYLMRALSRERDAGLIGFVLGCISFFALPHLVGYAFIGNNNTAHSLSLCLNILVWALIIRRQVAAALFVLAASSLLHPVNGLQAAGAGFVLALAVVRINGVLAWLRQPSVWLGVALFAAALLANLLPYRQAMMDEPLSDVEFIRIIGHLRHPHHLIPSTFGLLPWLLFGGFFLCFLYLTQVASLEIWQRRVMHYMASYLLLMVLLGYVFVELVPVRLVASIWPYRALLIFPLLFLAVLGQFVLDQLRAGRWWLALLLCLPFLPVRPHSSVYTWLLVDDLILIRYGLFAAAMLIALPFARLAPCRESGVRVVRLPVYLLIFCLPLLLWSVNWWTPDRLLGLPREPVYAQLRRYTEPDAVILSETRTAPNQRIRLHARRAVAASIDFPFMDKFYREWERRYKIAYGTLKAQYGAIDARTDAQLNCMADALGADYVVRSQPLDNPDHLLLIYEGKGIGRWGNDVYLYHNELEDLEDGTHCLAAAGSR